MRVPPSSIDRSAPVSMSVGRPRLPSQRSWQLRPKGGLEYGFGAHGALARWPRESPKNPDHSLSRRSHLGWPAAGCNSGQGLRRPTPAHAIGATTTRSTTMCWCAHVRPTFPGRAGAALEPSRRRMACWMALTYERYSCQPRGTSVRQCSRPTCPARIRAQNVGVCPWSK
jgi:hypothetical protein